VLLAHILSIEQAKQTPGRTGGGNMLRSKYTYSVYVDDNYDLPPDDERYKLGDFATLQAAVAACKGMVDEFLNGQAAPERTAAERYKQYTQFGPDPFILTEDPDVGPPPFSAWDYAKQQCQQE
jgi:hypothetical protein